MQLTERQVIHILRERFTSADSLITPSMSLKTDLGFDSLDVMELIVVLESEFDISFSDQESEQFETVDTVIELVYGKIDR